MTASFLIHDPATGAVRSVFQCMDADVDSLAAMAQANTPAGMARLEVPPGHPATYNPHLYLVKNGAATLIGSSADSVSGSRGLP
jgi:hypothetical protein